MEESPIAPPLTSKNDIMRPLRTLAGFDPKGSPYIGVQLGADGKPQFYRPSANGFIQTKEYAPGPATYVSLFHFIDCLKNLPEDAVELGLSANGILRIHGTNDEFESESHVHTVVEGQAGMKRHDIGDRAVVIDPTVFAKIDTRFFRCASSPVLAQGRLMLVTDSGATILWDGPDALKRAPELYPREFFLRLVSGAAPVEELVVTTKGYWGATVSDTVTFMRGHVLGRQIFDSYSAPGQEVAKLPARRLLVGLQAAVGLLEPTERVEVDPRLGVVAKGKFGDNRNSLGEIGSWTKFGMLAKTARVVHDALVQTVEDEAVLYSIPAPGSALVLRIKRGPFEVNFRAY